MKASPMANPDDTIFWPRHPTDTQPNPGRIHREPVPRAEQTTLLKEIACWVAIALLMPVKLALDVRDWIRKRRTK